MTRRVYLAIRTAVSALLCGASVLTATADAQTTVVLDTRGAVLDTFVRGGSHADTNYDNSHLVTRASADPTYVRRALLKFDTATTVPAGATIQSAVLTVTVRGGNSETRTLSAFRVAESFDAHAATWNDRKSATKWATAGTAVGSRYATARVSGTTGSTASFDLTTLVQEVVNGSHGSRYTRIALLDQGTSSKESYREFHSSEEANPSVRPRLTVVYGSSTTTLPPSGTAIKFLHWNLHHGVGTDGKYDIERIADWMVKMNPDVISLNEVEKYTWWGNEDQPGRYKAMLEAKTGSTWYMVWAQEYGNWSANGKGNLLLSRLPFVSWARYELSYERTVALGQVTVNGRHLTFASTHLDHEYASYRLQQTKEMMAWLTNFAENRIVGGDMNAQPTSPEMIYIKETYRDAWADAKAGGYADSAPDNPSGYTRRSRIDFVFTSKAASTVVPTHVEVVDTRDAGGYMPSDHRPLLVTYSVK